MLLESQHWSIAVKYSSNMLPSPLHQNLRYSFLSKNDWDYMTLQDIFKVIGEFRTRSLNSELTLIESRAKVLSPIKAASHS